MPGIVTNFLRNPSGNIAQIKKAAHHRSSRHSTPDHSDAEDNDHGHHHSHGLHAVKMPDLHRLPLPLPFVRRESYQTAVKLDCSIESPPIIFHGSPDESTGALVSGQMVIDVRHDVVEVDGFTACLRIKVTHKRPFQGHCHDCRSQRTELKSWTFLPTTTTLRRGKHLFPFSTLLDGHLPATVSSSLLDISYELQAVAHVAAASSGPTTTTSTPSSSAASTPSASSGTVRFDRTLQVRRAVAQPDAPKQSIRLFPPTNIKSTVTYPTVIHPTGTNRVTLKLDGLMSHNETARTLDIWRLKKISWKLEETTRVIAPACDKHAPAAEAIELPSTTAAPAATPQQQQAAEDATTPFDAAATTSTEQSQQESTAEAPAPAQPVPTKRGVVRTEVRLLGEKSMHGGWKSDYTGVDGCADVEFDYMINQRHRNGDLKFACDSRARDGTQITHSLLVELVVSKEFAPEGRPSQSGQTGTGRILRMHFPVILTEHSGLGVSWDEEAPPTYQDVPPSPPSYEVLDAPLVEYEDLETLDAHRISGEPSRRSSQS